jgi:hypothetical protein
VNVIDFKPVISVIVGAAAILFGAFGNKFYYSKSFYGALGNKPAPTWFGRLMFIGGGIVFIAAGLFRIYRG